MKSARAAAILFIAGMANGCQQTDEQKMASWLRRGLPPPFANCIAERTFDVLTTADVTAYHQRMHTRYLDLQRSGDAVPAAPRSLAEAQAAITHDLPDDTAERVSHTTTRCRIHNWRLD